MSYSLSKVSPSLGIQSFDPRDITTIEAEQQEYSTDPLNCHGGVPAITGMTLLDGMDLIAPRRNTFTLPLLAFVGSEDNLVNRPAIEQFYEAVASQDKTFFKVEGSKHETLHDKDRDMLIDRIANWILERAK